MSELGQAIASRRTFAIISHPDAGKTTITEKLLLLGQLIQVAGHSINAVNGALAGEYKPGPAAEDLDYQALQDLIAEAHTGLQQVSAEAVNALEGKEVITHWWPFAAEGFLMSFSLPSFYFHVTTAYDILRTKGVPVGKMDYLGALETKE